MVFERSLADLVRGIRTHKNDEATFINKCLAEIKEELKSPDMNKKVVAVQKLTYLQMLGYDISWAAFNVVEVMTSTKFSGKRIGFLAASQSFHEGTDVIIICTNLLRKDMTSPNTWEAGIALNCLANICTPDLARDLAADVVSLLNSSRIYVRKKACLVLYKIFLKFPDALRPSFPRLKDKLEDPEPGVVAAAVSVVCELAKRNPKNYIAIAPTLYKILTTSNNNWVLIKLVKLFGSLLQVEKRLAKKLIQPLHNIMNSTPAVSLMYECIQTCTIGLAQDLPTMKLCVNKLRNFVEDPDQNLKYLGLVALNNIMKEHPKAVAEHKDLIITCLDDEDVTIRLKALDLLEGMVSKRNVADIVRRLLEKAEHAEGDFKEGIVQTIISICSKNNYQYISDFEWYISVLMELAHTPGLSDSHSISNQFMDVIIRVKVVRPFGVKNMLELLKDPTLLPENPQEYAQCEMLYAAGWLTGEFANETPIDYLEAVESLLNSKNVVLPPHIQSVYIQSALKIFSIIAMNNGGSNDLLGSENGTKENTLLDEIIKEMKEYLPTFTQSNHSEVQERACFCLEILNLFETLRSNGVQIADQISSLFADPLNPVAPKAQKKVPVPEGLDLDAWINEPEEEEEYEFDKGFEFLSHDYEDTSEEEIAAAQQAETQREVHRQRRAHDPFYLNPSETTKVEILEEEIPTVTLSERDLGGLKVETSSANYKTYLKKKPSKQKKSASRPTVLQTEIMPEGVTPSSEESDSEEDNPFKTIDFKAPLKPEEQLPIRTHRVVAPQLSAEKPKKEKKKKKEKEDSKKKKKHSKKEKNVLIDMGGEEEKKKSSKTKEKKGKKNKPPAPESAPEQPKQMPKYKPLCQDENISVIYEVRVNPNERRKILVNFAFKNLSSGAITNLKFDIPATLNIKPSSQSSMNTNAALEAGQTNQHNILFEISSISEPMKVTGSIVYKIDGKSASKEFKLLFPCSSFLYPVKLQKEEFVSLLKNGNFSMSSNKVRTDKDFRSFVATLGNTFRLDLVIFDDKTACFYGKSIQGHDVAIYSKVFPDHFSLDLKCSDATLGDSLAEESKSLF